MKLLHELNYYSGAKPLVETNPFRNFVPMFDVFIAGVNNASNVIVLSMEYGKDFSGPGSDPFKSNRATGDPSEAHTSNFLHPVLYFYAQLPRAVDMYATSEKEVLPQPDRIHHVVEDFLTDFSAPDSHQLPIRSVTSHVNNQYPEVSTQTWMTFCCRRFLENALNVDMRRHFAQECFLIAMTHTSLPLSCHEYLQNRGLFANDVIFSLTDKIKSRQQQLK